MEKIPEVTHDMIARELMNGMWFMLGLILVMAFSYRLAQYVLADRWLGNAVQFRGPVLKSGWYRVEAVWVLIGMLVYFIGSVARSGWVWTILTCQNLYGHSACLDLTQNYWVLAVASVFAIVGATCLVRIFSPPSWRPWSWIGAGVVGVAVPVIAHVW